MARDIIGAIFLLELLARIAGPGDHGPYLAGLTASEPPADFEGALYEKVNDG